MNRRRQSWDLIEYAASGNVIGVARLILQRLLGVNTTNYIVGQLYSGAAYALQCKE